MEEGKVELAEHTEISVRTGPQTRLTGNAEGGYEQWNGMNRSIRI